MEPTRKHVVKGMQSEMMSVFGRAVEIASPTAPHLHERALHAIGRRFTER